MVPTKRCTTCHEALPLDMFNKLRKARDGLSGICRTCHKVHLKTWRDENKARISEYDKWYNREKRLPKAQKPPKPPREPRLSWGKRHPEKRREKSAHYDAAKAHAIPPWLSVEDRQLILAKYKEAVVMSKTTGVQYHVDHIVPLRSKVVCGLHVPWNLRVITAYENCWKRNLLLDQP